MNHIASSASQSSSNDSNNNNNNSLFVTTPLVSYLLLLICFCFLSYVITNTFFTPSSPIITVSGLISSVKKTIPTTAMAVPFNHNGINNNDDSLTASSSSSTNDLSRISWRNQQEVNEHEQIIKPKFVHVVVLMHGVMGNSKELLYLEQTLNKFWMYLQTHQTKKEGTNNSAKEQKLIVHSATASNGNTLDGIAAGGHRLAIEVNQLLQNIAEQYNDDEITITLSIVGNSLGGLYSRYALSEIDFTVNQQKNIIPAVFCTLVTPHLGVSENTYIKVPRTIEMMAAKVMKQTGYDLFRLDESNIIDEMTTDSKYIQPLQNFYHRRAYANAHNTDFQVPFRTAAFVSETNSLHYHRQHKSYTDNNEFVLAMMEEEDSTNGEVSATISNNNKQIVSLMVETLPSCINNNNYVNTNSKKLEGDEIDSESGNNINSGRTSSLLTLDEMAVRLDSLGWTKVFCDMRESLLSVPNPLTLWSSFKNDNNNNKNNNEASSSAATTNTEKSNSGNRDRSRTFPVHEATSYSTINENDNEETTTTTSTTTATSYTSKSLMMRFGGITIDRWHIPFGHSVLVVNSKTEWYGKLNSGGRPMVHQIATDLIEQITQISTRISTNTTTSQSTETEETTSKIETAEQAVESA